MSIGKSLKLFRDTKTLEPLVIGLSKIVQQRRLLECALGLYLFLRHRPGPVHEVPLFGLDLANPYKQPLFAPEEAAVCRFLFRLRSEYQVDIYAKSNLARVGEHFIAGEYAERGNRLFFYTPALDKIALSNYYDNHVGVRHIYLVYAYSTTQFFVATGDSSKRFDLFEISDNEVKFRKRNRPFLGGFTASCQVGPDHYFGTDFSLRPNYLWQMRDGKRFFLPQNSFYLFVHQMDVIDDRYIVGYGTNLWDRSYTSCFVFDSFEERFVLDRIFLQDTASVREE